MSLLDYLKDFRIAFLVFLIILLVVLDALFGGPHVLHLGVEFIGGTQIPIQLEHSVDPSTMGTLINTLQQRLSTFGLKQVTVEGIGTSEVYVTIPTVSESEVAGTIAIIESQGVFQGIVNGKEAVNGTDLISGSIGAARPQVSNGNVTWQVSFFITQQAAAHFAKVVFGQANEPLYMFLDRPTGAIIMFNSSKLLTQSQVPGANETALVQAMNSAVALGNRTIPLVSYGTGSSSQAVSFISLNRNKYSKLIVAKDAPQQIISNATALNYTIQYETTDNITPRFVVIPSLGGGKQIAIESWPASGLLSSPLLSPGVTNGTIEQSYEVSGIAPQTLALQAKTNYAQNQSDKIVSILKGGALPVLVIVGAPTTIPPTLGRRFEIISALALVVAVIAVLTVMEIRYRKWFLIWPIMFTTLAEMFIILSIIGLIGTIDLAAVAGMIAVIGTGVDAQIIITDEFLGKGDTQNRKIRLSNAFYIIWADSALLIIAMLPLFFSTSLVQIIGFAESTMLGVLFGAFVTRPAYGSIISRHYAAKG